MLITKKVFKDFILLKQNKSLYWKWQVIIHTESLNSSPLQEAASIWTLSNHLASYGIKKNTSFIVVLIKNCTKWLIYQTFDFVLINDFPWFMSLPTDLFWGTPYRDPPSTVQRFWLSPAYFQSIWIFNFCYLHTNYMLQWTKDLTGNLPVLFKVHNLLWDYMYLK